MIFTEMGIKQAILWAKRGEILKDKIFLETGFLKDPIAMNEKIKDFNKCVEEFNSKLHAYEENSVGGAFCRRCGAIKQIPESPCPKN